MFFKMPCETFSRENNSKQVCLNVASVATFSFPTVSFNTNTAMQLNTLHIITVCASVSPNVWLVLEQRRQQLRPRPHRDRRASRSRPKMSKKNHKQSGQTSRTFASPSREQPHCLFSRGSFTHLRQHAASFVIIVS